MDEAVVHDLSLSMLEAPEEALFEAEEALQMELLSQEEEGNQADLSIQPSEEPGCSERQGSDSASLINPKSDDYYSTGTMEVLSQMPSRTISYSQGAIVSAHISQSVQLYHRRQRPARKLSRPLQSSACAESDFPQDEQLVTDLQAFSSGELLRVLRTVPLSVAKKRELRRLAGHLKQTLSISTDEAPSQSQVIVILQESSFRCLSFLQSMQLWQEALKRMGNHFGTGVLSYFTFLKSLLLFNVILLLITSVSLAASHAFLTSQSIYNGSKFTGLDLLTGAGSFSDSPMFYGYYTNSTVNHRCHSTQCNSETISYHFPLVYFITIGVTFLVTCIFLVCRLYKLFRGSFNILKHRSNVAAQLFSSLDFKVTKMTSVKLQSENTFLQLKELLLDEPSGKTEPIWGRKIGRAGRLVLRLVAWAVCVGSTLACSACVFYLSQFVSKWSTSESSSGKEVHLLIVPTTVSSINLLLPVFFKVVSYLERYDSTSTSAYIAIFRVFFLKVSMLGSLCYFWLRIVPYNQMECWESFVGQELYRLLVVDYIFTLLETIFGNFIGRLILQKVLKIKKKLEFDIASNMLELIYGQTLVWFGLLFAPLLPAMQIFRLFLLFYVKKTSVMVNYQVSRKRWRAEQMNSLFITLMCFPCFLGAVTCVTYSTWMLTPSSHCGPFRGLATMSQSGKQWVENVHSTWFSFIYFYLVEDPIFLFLLVPVLIFLIYFHTQVVDGQRKITVLLKEQIKNEGGDKKFLITKLEKFHKKVHHTFKDSTTS